MPGEFRSDGRLLVRVDADLEDLIPMFLERRTADIDTLRELLQRRDLEAIRMIGHTMKGTAGAFGFDGISSIGAVLERAATDGDAASISACVDELRAYLDQVEVVLEPPRGYHPGPGANS